MSGKGKATFDYWPTPTGIRFHASSSRVRVVIGPVGCLPGWTEVMTPRGWVRMDECRDGTPILQWDAESGVAEFAKPLIRVKTDCSEMLYFDCGRHFSMTVTENHRVPLYSWNGKFVVKSAAEVAAHPSKHRVPTTWTKNGGLQGFSDAQLRLWVAIAADGSYPRRGKQCVCSFRKSRKIDRLESLLREAGVEYDKRTSVRRSGAVETRIVFDRPGHPKHFDWRLAKCTSHQAEVIVGELRHWDGKFTTDYNEFCTTDRRDADIVQFLAHTCGRNAVISSHKDRRNAAWSEVYSVSISRPDSPKRKVAIRCDGTKVTLTKPEDGFQYCFTTSTGYFVVRQNGHIFITGNSGKTWMNWMEIYRVTAERMPPMADGVIRARWVVIRNTYDELKSTTLATAKNIFNREGLHALDTHESPPLEGWLRLPAPDGTPMELHLLFRAMDQPKAIDHLLGLEISGIYVNEMPQVPQAAVDSAMSRLGRYPPKDGDRVFPSLGVLGDGNPLDQSNWVYRKMQELPEGWEFFNQPPALLRIVDPETNEVRYENNVGQDPAFPAAENVENHNEGFTYWRNQLGMAQDKIDRFILCKWVAKKAGRPVYPEWSPEFHVAKKPLEFSQNLPVIFGQDFGRTPCAVIGQVGLDGQIRILREITSDNMGIADFVTQKLRPTLINDFDLYHVKAFGFGDPAGADPTQVDDITCIETMNRLGLNVVPAPVTPYGVRGYHNSSVTRINNVSEVLNRRIGTAPAIIVDPSCKVLIGGFNGDYHYRRMRLDGVAEEDAKYTDEPDKGHPVSDVHDALQYFVCGVKNSGMDFSNPYAPDGYEDPGMAEAISAAGGMEMCF